MYHPQALEIFNMTSDLKQCLVSKNLDQGFLQIFYPVKPMLAGKLTIPKMQEFVRQKADVADCVYVETKFDGERI
jgi:ATP-dependent DNA ligase